MNNEEFAFHLQTKINNMSTRERTARLKKLYSKNTLKLGEMAEFTALSLKIPVIDAMDHIVRKLMSGELVAATALLDQNTTIH